MLRSFLGWLDDYLAGEAPSAVLRAVAGLLSFAALLGALLGSVAVKAGVLVATLLALIGFALLLLADRRSLQHKYESHRRLVSHYCDYIGTRLGCLPQITDWRQVTVIDLQGNAHETVVVQAKTLADEVHFFRLRIGPGWAQPTKYRRKVRVNVRGLSVEGVPGTRMELTCSWLANGKLDLLAHFHSPLSGGSEIRLHLDWTWPGKATPLMLRKVPDSFTFEFCKPVTFATQKIILPSGYDAYFEPVGFRGGQAGFAIGRTTNERGQVEFNFEAHQLDADHSAGMRLELKGRDALPV